MTTDRSHTTHARRVQPDTHDQPVQPEIPRSKYARGMLRQDRDPFALRLGGFGDGQRTTTPPARGPHRGRFSQGQEALGDEDPAKHIRRRYSEGLEGRRSA
jgi:hypothetical protein